MKKILLTIICCLAILLYIPFNTSALIYNGSLTDIPYLNELMINKLNELYNSSNNFSNVLIYSNSNGLAWSYDITKFDSSSNDITIRDRFYMGSNGNITAISNDLYNFNLNGENTYILYLKYDNKIFYKNDNLNDSNNINNYLLFSVSYENVKRTNYCRPAVEPQQRAFSVIDYDIINTVTGTNFDVYYIVNDKYILIQRNIDNFVLKSHYSKSKSNDSSLGCVYPDFPPVPSNTSKTYSSSIKYDNYYFVFNDTIDTNTITVKAPDTDSLITDGNTNSQSATSNNDQSNQLLNNTVNQMESLENEYKSNLNSNLDNINVNDFNISGITQLSNAANFVRVQFDNLTKNNPFGIILGFSLFLGLSLLIIGKRL